MDEIVAALAAERAGYLRANKADRVIPVDEQLALRGYCVDADGNLVEIDKTTRAAKVKPANRPRKETAAKAPAPERAVED